jgi:hypothetical protein
MHVTTSFGEEQILALANTIHGAGGHYNVRVSPGMPDHDHLDTPERAHAFLGSHTAPVPGQLPSEPQLARLRSIRTVARELVQLAPDEAVAAWRAHVGWLFESATYRLDADGRLEAAASGWDGIADALLPPLVELEGERSRLTHCGNETCRFLFLDRSRNHSRRWCEMAVCGNRVKLRRHRRRTNPPPAAQLRAAGPGQPGQPPR